MRDVEVTNFHPKRLINSYHVLPVRFGHRILYHSFCAIHSVSGVFPRHLFVRVYRQNARHTTNLRGFSFESIRGEYLWLNLLKINVYVLIVVVLNAYTIIGNVRRGPYKKINKRQFSNLVWAVVSRFLFHQVIVSVRDIG